jgi:hypothetical protein
MPTPGNKTIPLAFHCPRETKERPPKMQVEHVEAIPGKKRPNSNDTRRRTVIAGRPLVEPLEARIAPAALTVSSLSDTDTAGTLVFALQQANGLAAGTATTINFTVKGTIHLTSTLSITNDVTLNGAGIVLKGNGSIQDLSITGGITGGGGVTINGLKITGGKALAGASGGGVYIDYTGGTVTLAGCTITGNHAIGQKGLAQTDANSGTDGGDADGGGIAIIGGAVMIQNSTISGNSAVGGVGGPGGYNGGSAAGGGIFNQGTLTLLNSHITGNTATGGAGTSGTNGIPYTAANGVDTPATPGGSGGNAYGGGIANSGGAVQIETSPKTSSAVFTSVISGNTVKGGAGGSGGKSYNGSNGVNFHVTKGAYGGPVPPTGGGDGGSGANGGNGGNAGGGGISSTDGSVTIVKATISGNTVAGGAGGNGTNGGSGGKGGNGGSTPTTHANGTTYYGTTYSGYSGGAGGDGGDAGNAGFAQGGGIFSQDALTIQISTVSGNTVKAAPAGTFGHGGAAGAHGTHYPAGGTPPTKGDDGAAGTTTPSGGGGIYFGGGELAISLDTIAKNSAQDGGGVNVTADTSATIDNSTIALNSASVSGGGLFVAAHAAEPTVILSIIAQNTTKHKTGSLADYYGSLNPDSIGNVIISPSPAVNTTLAIHDGGTMDTLLPVSGLPTFANSASTNPDGWGTDQNGTTMGANIVAGSVQ